MAISGSKISRELFRPIWSHAIGRLQPQVDELRQRVDEQGQRVGELRPRVDELRQRVDELGQRVDRGASGETSLNQYIPAFLNAVRSVRAFGYELGKQRRELTQLTDKMAEVDQWQDERLALVKGEMAKLAEKFTGLEQHREERSESVGQDMARLEQRLWERLEFVRRELMYEVRYIHATPVAKAPARVVSAHSLPTENIRLNLGCGHIPLDGYVNVDLRELPGVDIVAPVDAIPLEGGSVSEIFSSHLVEHFPQEMLRRRLLPYWRDLLKPGGVFRAIAPDGEAMIKAAGDACYDFEDFREVLFGAQDYEGDFHHNLLWPDSFARLLGEAGFENVEVGARGRRNGKCFEFEIAAHKPQ